MKDDEKTSQTSENDTTNNLNFTNIIDRSNVTNLINFLKGDLHQLPNINSYISQVISQNLDEILIQINSLREIAQQFPESKQKEVLVNLNHLQEDVIAPEKRELPRIREHILALIAIVSAVGTFAAGAADFTNNVSDFTNNLVELSEKIGIPIRNSR